MRVPTNEPPGRAQTGPTECPGDEIRFVAGDAMDTDALGHRLVHGVPGIERAGGILKDHLRLAAQAPEGAPAVVGKASVEPDRSRRDRFEAEHGAQQRRLAAAGLTDEGNDFAALDFEADAVDGADWAMPAGERDVDVVDDEQRIIHRPSRHGRTPPADPRRCGAA